MNMTLGELGNTALSYGQSGWNVICFAKSFMSRSFIDLTNLLGGYKGPVLTALQETTLGDVGLFLKEAGAKLYPALEKTGLFLKANPLITAFSVNLVAFIVLYRLSKIFQSHVFEAADKRNADNSPPLSKQLVREVFKKFVVIGGGVALTNTHVMPLLLGSSFVAPPAFILFCVGTAVVSAFVLDELEIIQEANRQLKSINDGLDIIETKLKSLQQEENQIAIEESEITQIEGSLREYGKKWILTTEEVKAKPILARINCLKLKCSSWKRERNLLKGLENQLINLESQKDLNINSKIDKVESDLKKLSSDITAVGKKRANVIQSKLALIKCSTYNKSYIQYVQNTFSENILEEIKNGKDSQKVQAYFALFPGRLDDILIHFSTIEKFEQDAPQTREENLKTKQLAGESILPFIDFFPLSAKSYTPQIGKFLSEIEQAMQNSEKKNQFDQLYSRWLSIS